MKGKETLVVHHGSLAETGGVNTVPAEPGWEYRLVALGAAKPGITNWKSRNPTTTKRE